MTTSDVDDPPLRLTPKSERRFLTLGEATSTRRLLVPSSMQFVVLFSSHRDDAANLTRNFTFDV